VAALPSADPDRFPPDLTVHWMAANVSAAVVAVLLGLAAFGVRQLLGLPDPNADIFVKIVLLIIEIIVAATTLAVYANRTGAVLQRRVPAFPMLTWSALHILIGIIVGAFIAFAEMGASPSSYEAPPGSTVVSVAIGGMLAGAFIGAALGALQALVLRKVVREVATWIQWSALAGTAFGGYALVLYIGTEPVIGNEILTQLVSFAVTVVGAIVMLPAVHRLEPR
jgi:hypothetical protein